MQRLWQQAQCPQATSPSEPGAFSLDLAWTPWPDGSGLCDGLCTITAPGLPPALIHHCLFGSDLSAQLNLLLFIFGNIYLCVWLHWVPVTATRIFSFSLNCSMDILVYGMWDLVP